MEELLAAYRAYLRRERGLAATTVGAYGKVARLFLSQRSGPDGLDVEHLSAGDVVEFVLAQCHQSSVGSAEYVVTALRCLPRFPHVEGWTGQQLAHAVPAVAGGRTGLPKALDAAQVTALMASCDQDSAVGLRDYAILVLLARLGLRAGEVADPRLADVDWRAGQIEVTGKARRSERLPLPADVGQALAAYLRGGRPRVDDRTLSVRARAPHGPLGAGGVKTVVRGACDRAGLPRVGAHRLRHTAATEMLRAGAPLSEIAQVLRHRSLSTTAIYAKVDLAALRPLALPWPGGGA
ncbi:MAG: site-specific integrase [Pseudonocardiaceae bacterium]